MKTLSSCLLKTPNICNTFPLCVFLQVEEEGILQQMCLVLKLQNYFIIWLLYHYYCNEGSSEF